MEPKTNLRRLRESAGISLRELARQVGQQPSNLSYWERNGKLPKSEVLLPMADALGVSVDDLLGRRKKRQVNGLPGRARRTFEQISKLPRSQQTKILEVVDALLLKQQMKLSGQNIT